MGSGKKPDPRRKKFQAPHSTYLKVECGKTYGGWSAGEYYGCYAHRVGNTKPCCANITDDAMECPYCVSGMEAVWRAWVPVWDVDWTLRHVLIGEEIAPSVDAIPFRAKVSLSRHKNPISPMVVREDAKSVNRELPAVLPWAWPVPMLAVCLVLWDIPALTRWCEDKNLLALGAPAAPTLPDAKPIKMPAKANVAKAFKASEVKEIEVGALLNGTLNRVKALEAAGKVTPNGKHKPEE